MTVRRRVAAGAVVALLALSACGSKTPDYQSIWSTGVTTPSASTSGSPSTEAPIPFSDYLERLGVRGEPVPSDKLTDITVTMPSPKGWQRYTDPSSAPGTVVIARNNTYPTATLVAFKLHGDFDVADAIKHANADATMSQNFTKLNESFADFDGFPSAMIEGSYDNAKGDRLHTYNRIVIPVTKTFQRYLVQLTVTSKADQAVADADDIQAIIDGFTVKVP
ncbi:LpqN/LpqT family lipoprotein [Mycolicibacterium komossense]|uniref:LpqN/LpqT family lipoprotein n=1 Tax=Mycolicibacterium komossense TaxID=1779 RepID=A0ABT3CEA8_9MYCO|nr:LpqN/LpqT family lipoprotein [Mycolicibacterium komossense]MCV7227813.1 LpqN/LpqT family lipoprotein [Mycolicibacterium komossense]